MNRRFRATQAELWAFAGETLVVCPKCGGCARAATLDPESRSLFAPRRMTCGTCGHTRAWEDDSIARGDGRPVDDYFHVPLWIQAPCCGHVLWAYDWRHLDVIADYVAADLRERRRDPQWGWSNRALVSRLPRWMKLQGNRERIAACIASLRARG